MQQVDVIVNGAGPVGLLCAYILMKKGHSVYLTDKKTGPTEHSRAFGVSPRTMEILQHYGLAYRILQEALCIRGSALYVNGTHMGEVNFEEVNCVFPQLSSLAQSRIESIIVEEIESLPQGKVQWNTELLKYEQHDDKVVAHFKDVTTNETFSLSTNYIVGADGCHSLVRKQDSTWTYEGHAIKSEFALADLVVGGPDVSKIMHRQVVFYQSIGGCILIPLPHQGKKGTTTIRMVANMGTYETDNGPRVTHGTDNPRNVLTLDKVKEIMKERMTGLDIDIKESHWLTYFNVNERIANGFRRNRAFVIGDAAHCHSPAGGQGMNIGFHDAENLAWKLSVVLSGESSDPEKLLNSFSIEREPMVKEVMTTTGALSRVLLSNSYIMSMVRYVAISTAFNVPFIRRNMINRILQVNFKLGESPILAGAGTNQQSLIKVGQFISDTRALLNKDVTDKVERKTLYQLLEPLYTKHTAFWLVSRYGWQHEPANELTNAFIQGISGYKACRGMVVQSVAQYSTYINNKNENEKLVDHWIDTHAISSPESLTSTFGFTTHLTTSASSSRIPPAALVVVRPDRYVAYSSLISTTSELDDAFTFLDTYLLQSS